MCVAAVCVSCTGSYHSFENPKECESVSQDETRDPQLGAERGDHCDSGADLAELVSDARA